MSSLWRDFVQEQIRDNGYACPGNRYIEQIKVDTVGHRCARKEKNVFCENRIAEVDRRVPPVTMCVKKYDQNIYDRSQVQVGIKGRLLFGGVMKTLMYGCVT